MTDSATPRVDVVVVAYGPEPWLDRCVEAALGSRDVDVRVVLVDNGGTEGRAERLGGLDGVTLVSPGDNVGFAKGCNLGAAVGEGDFVALVNPDAVVEPGALAALVEVAADDGVGIATGSIRLSDAPDRLNSAGNDIHYLGLSWSGSFDEPASSYPERREVTGASGAGLLCRREVWETLGGFDDEFFAYHEDADLSLRCWQRGLSIVYVPEAVVIHRYEFSRNTVKYHLVERNRLVMVLTAFGRRHLLMVAPALVGLELAMLVLAAAQGWLPEKLAGYRWLISNRRWLRERRGRLQGSRVVSEARLTPLFTARLDPANMQLPFGAGLADRLFVAYWWAARRFI